MGELCDGYYVYKRTWLYSLPTLRSQNCCFAILIIVIQQRRHMVWNSLRLASQLFLFGLFSTKVSVQLKNICHEFAYVSGTQTNI